MAEHVCPQCGAGASDLMGYVQRDYVQAWECKKCGHVWPRFTDASWGPLSKKVADAIIKRKNPEFALDEEW